MVEAVPLPDDALLRRYAGTARHFTDCYRAHVARPVTLAEFAAAF